MRNAYWALFYVLRTTHYALRFMNRCGEKLMTLTSLISSLQNKGLLCVWACYHDFTMPLDKFSAKRSFINTVKDHDDYCPKDQVEPVNRLPGRVIVRLIRPPQCLHDRFAICSQSKSILRSYVAFGIQWKDNNHEPQNYLRDFIGAGVDFRRC